MKVIGIDPSLTGTGIASSDGWCETVGRNGVTTLPLAARIDAVDALLENIVVLVGRPDLVVIELPAFTRAGGGAVERHALFWLLIRRLIGSDIPLATVTSSQRTQYATGKGGAKKTMVVDAVARRLPMFATGGDDNLCDAAVICAMGADRLGMPLAAMPAVHRLALTKVDWPELAGSVLV